MTTFLIFTILVMTAYIIKVLIKINSLVLFIIKDKTVNEVPNELEKNYQFIKGLY